MTPDRLFAVAGRHISPANRQPVTDHPHPIAALLASSTAD